MHFILSPWPWYVAGPLIGLMVPLLLLTGNKALGISSSLRHICASCIPFNIHFFKYDWRKEIWNLYFVAGIVAGAWFAQTVLSNHAPAILAGKTAVELSNAGITSFNGFLPKQLFSWGQLLTLRGFIFMIVGGFLVGFGTRYAGGCTSGHAISGIANLQWPSLVATICFFTGGLATTWFVIPYLFRL